MKNDLGKSRIFPRFIFGFFIFLFFFSFTSAFGYVSDSTILDFGTFNQGERINLIQTCPNCSFNNITKIKLPDGSLLNINSAMTKSGTFYNYSLIGNFTTQIGEYRVYGVGNPNGIDDVWVYKFSVSGGNQTFFIIVFLLFFGLTFYGIKIKNPWITLIGSFGISILGVYVSFNGIGLYKNSLTETVSYIVIAMGLGLGFESVREIIYS